MPTAKRPTTQPYLAAPINQTTAWFKPKPRKEPITIPMIMALRDELQAEARHSDPSHVFVTLRYLVYNIEHLTIYIGSRIAEYSQSNIAKGHNHLKGHFFGVWSNSVVRGTEFLQFGLTIRHF
jgi:hypothetical protein